MILIEALGLVFLVLAFFFGGCVGYRLRSDHDLRLADAVQADRDALDAQLAVFVQALDDLDRVGGQL